jgi:hypothetical protein
MPTSSGTSRRCSGTMPTSRFRLYHHPQPPKQINKIPPIDTPKPMPIFVPVELPVLFSVIVDFVGDEDVLDVEEVAVEVVEIACVVVATAELVTPTVAVIDGKPRFSFVACVSSQQPWSLQQKSSLLH